MLAAGGERLDVAGWRGRQRADEVERDVRRGVAARLPARLPALRVPAAAATERRRKLRSAAKREGKTPSAAALARADWTLLVTNVPAERLSAAAARVLLRARWQIELLCKPWKQHGRVDQRRTRRPERIRCEVDAKLLVVVAQHWLLVVGCWACPDRSPVKAAATRRAWAPPLALHPADAAGLGALLTGLAPILTRCTRNKRRRHPATFQLLAAPSSDWA